MNSSRPYYGTQGYGNADRVPPPVNNGVPPSMQNGFPPPVSEEKASPPQWGTGNMMPFGGIKLDEEKMIIIFLIIILARNGADIPLLAALGYLLM